MIFSKWSLQIFKLASKDGFDQGLNGIRFESDGAVCAGNKKAMIAVEPMETEPVLFSDKIGEQMEPGPQGVIMPIDFIEKALKNMSRDKRLGLQFLTMTRVKDPARIGFTSVDEKGNTVTNTSLPKYERFPDWKKTLNELKQNNDGLKICLNRGDLIELLKTLEMVCPGKGETDPIFLEINEEGLGLIARCLNHETGQHAIGAITAYSLKEDQWLSFSKWEQRLFGIADYMVKKIKKKKKLPKKKRSLENGKEK